MLTNRELFSFSNVLRCVYIDESSSFYKYRNRRSMDLC